MRALALLAIVPLGCGGLFEENPDFVEDSEAAASDDDDDDDDDDNDNGDDDDDNAGSADGSGGGAGCDNDEFELNDVESSSFQLPFINGQMQGEDPAMLEGPGAVDWYQYGARQEPGDNAVAKAFVTDAEGLRICIYIKCEGNDEVEPVLDCASGEPDTAPSGRPGCCNIDTVEAAHTCAGASDTDVFVWARVSDAMDRDVCLPYTLQRSFWPE